MKDTELVSALRNLKINTTGLACLGCNYGFQCSVSGCRLIGMAADRLNEVGIILSIIKGMHEEAKESEKTLLGIVMSLFNRYYMIEQAAPEQKTNRRNDAIDALTYSVRAFPPRKRITDFERCTDTSELADTLRCIDDSGYEMSGVTQDASGVYTVFFRRPAQE